MGWDMLSWSFAVLRKDLKLLLFPLISGSAAAVAGFLVAGFHSSDAAGYATLFLWYLAVSVVMVFSNCALAACALAHFAGRQTSLSYGIQQAAARSGDIFLWALLSSTLGLAIHALERRLSFGGKLAVWLFGVAWGTATFFVVPILIAEDRGPLESLRRSSRLLPKTWSDQLVTQIRLGWGSAVVFLPVMAIGLLGGFHVPVYRAIAIAYAGVVTAAVMAAQGIFQAALYRYAAFGEAPADWAAGILSGYILPDRRPPQP